MKVRSSPPPLICVYSFIVYSDETGHHRLDDKLSAKGNMAMQRTDLLLPDIECRNHGWGCPFH